jgi:hypothetical protein
MFNCVARLVSFLSTQTSMPTLSACLCQCVCVCVIKKNNIQPQILSEFSFSLVRGDDVQVEE